MLDSYTITIKQNVWFEVGICDENFLLNKIQSAAIIDINMHDILENRGR